MNESNPLSSQYPIFDVVIIGGGINGAAIARDAALRGMHVALLEKEDFGAGSSTKTSKLAHGGLRYLEQWNFHLVRESLKERALLLKNAPHLTNPLPFILPVYARDPKPLWQIQIGLCLYDYLGGNKELPSHRKVEREEILKKFPKLKDDHLRGGYLYSDVQMSDNRLVLENILGAEEAGVFLLNHAPVVDLWREDGRIKGVAFLHPSSGKREVIEARIVVNATGAWSNEVSGMLEGTENVPRVKPTKGIHLILPEISEDYALILRAPQDGRVFFILPWQGYSLVGSTDTFYEGNPDQILVTEEDQNYLLGAVNEYFPELSFGKSSIITVFGGLRPLVAARSRLLPSQVSREHFLQISSQGLVSVLGGKFTTHRKIAEEVVDKLVQILNPSKPYLNCITAEKPLPGAYQEKDLNDLKDQFHQAGVEQVLMNHLISHYGMRSLEILKVIQEDPKEGKQICPFHPHCLAEISYAIKVEHARTLADWFLRRTAIAYTACKGLCCSISVAGLFAAHLNWSMEEQMRQLDHLQKELVSLNHL